MTFDNFLARLQAVKRSGNTATARCPAHEDRRSSLSIAEAEDGRLLVNCHAGCETQAIVAKLGLNMKDLFGPNGRPRGLRKEIVATYDYHDAEGNLLYQVVRFRPKGFAQRRPDPDRPGEYLWNLKGTTRFLYRLPEVLEAIEAGKTIILAEGERDVESLRALGFRATTNCGGADKWNRAYTTVLSKAPHVVIIPDNDEPGRAHAYKVARQLPNGVILELPGLPDKGDVTDWIRTGGTRDELVRLAQAAIDSPPPLPAEPAPEPGKKPIREPSGDDLAGLSVTVNDYLNAKMSRANKQAVGQRITEWFRENGRLLRDVSDANRPAPYAIVESGAAVPIDGDADQLQVELATAGLNMTEPAFRWAVADLKTESLKHGRQVLLARYSASRADVVYISSGPMKMVRAKPAGTPDEPGGEIPVQLELLPNGADGVLFAGDACWPTWEPGKPVALESLRVFQPPLVAPDEARGYSPAAQACLLRGWLVGVVANVRPLPVLTMAGGHGSGKTTLARACIRIPYGVDGDLATTPSDPRDLIACACRHAMHGIDNLDGAVEDPILDCLAASATGGVLRQRVMRTNDQVMEKRITAAFVVTTRTAAFAQRPDIGDRCLPLFFAGDLDSYADDNELLAEVEENRAGLLSWLAIRACRALNTPPASVNLGRFVRFANMVVESADDPIEAAGVFESWQRAQRLGLTDLDPLLEAVLRYFDEPELASFTSPVLRGTATEVLNALAERREIPFQGGAKIVSRKLSEFAPTLKLSGIRVVKGAPKGRAFFEISRVDT